MKSVRFRNRNDASKGCSPQLSHAIQELFPAEHTLCGCSKLPSHHKYAYASWVQHKVITELLDSIDPYLILILRICGNFRKTTYR